MLRVSVLSDSVRDLSPLLLDERGEYVTPSAHLFAATSWQERAVFGHKRGMYVLPTTELVEWLRGFIGDRFAMEVGAGCGVLAREVGMLAVDNYLQTWPEVAALYRASAQPVIDYGRDVENRDADSAAAHYRPDVIVGAWMTHKYDPNRHGAGGSVYAPDFDHLLAHCAQLVLICNEDTHANHPLLSRPHQRHAPPWLYSRAQSGRDFIGIWRGAKP